MLARGMAKIRVHQYCGLHVLVRELWYVNAFDGVTQNNRDAFLRFVDVVKALNPVLVPFLHLPK
jgi:hypothetical protein